MPARREAKTKPRRRTQEERRATTRAALLDATISCLIEYGYGGVTTTRVVERAGVSRGAQVHHFPTKAALVSEAVRHLAARRTAEMLPELMKISGKPEKERLEQVLDLLWTSHSGELFQAALELWVAARTDPELRKHLEAVERDVITSVWSNAGVVFGEEVASRPGFVEDLETALAAMRGLALLRSFTGESARDLDRRWIQVRARLLRIFEAATPPVRSTRRRRAA
jgi:AcrR family transcriptional regulator